MIRSMLRVLSVLGVLSVVAAAVSLTTRGAPAFGAVSSETSATSAAAAAAGALPEAAAVLHESRARQDGSVLRHRETRAAAARAAAARAAEAQAAAARKVAARQLALREAAARERAAAVTRQRATRDATRDPRAVARIMVAERGWSSGQFSCLKQLWMRESGWKVRADNPTSSAYGIPQALPGSKMASAGPDWQTNPVTQIRWGLGYIEDRYGTPCAAWAHSESHNWY